MSRRERFLEGVSQKPCLSELFVMRFTANIRKWDSLVNDVFSSEEDFEECLANWYIIKNECRNHFSSAEVDDLIDKALRRIADETLQRNASDETAC